MDISENKFEIKDEGVHIIMKDNNNKSADDFGQEANILLTERDFSFIKRGMSFKEIADKIGTGDGLIGSGVISPYYNINNGKVILHFKYNFDFVTRIYVNYSDGSNKTIDLNQ
jgi:hypothetical protein